MPITYYKCDKNSIGEAIDFYIHPTFKPQKYYTYQLWSIYFNDILNRNENYWWKETIFIWQKVEIYFETIQFGTMGPKKRLPMTWAFIKIDSREWHPFFFQETNPIWIHGFWRRKPWLSNSTQTHWGFTKCKDSICLAWGFEFLMHINLNCI